MKGKLLLVSLMAAAVLAGCAGARKDEAKPAAAPAQQQPAAPAAQGNAGTVASGKYVIVQSESNAQYEVKETFITQKLNATAIGKTSVITGDLVFDAKGAIQPSKVVVDVTTLKSDKEKRDDKIRTSGLETDKYKTAEFAITGVEGTAPAIGSQEATFKLKGNLTVHGVEKPVVWDAKAMLADGGKVKLSATITFKMEQFNMTPPSILGMINVEDEVKLQVDLVGAK